METTLGIILVNGVFCTVALRDVSVCRDSVASTVNVYVDGVGDASEMHLTLPVIPLPL